MLQLCKNIPFYLESTIAVTYDRHLLFLGHMNSLPITLLNINASNTDNPDFFLRIFEMISASCSKVNIGGDFNCFLDPFLDSVHKITPQNSFSANPE